MNRGSEPSRQGDSLERDFETGLDETFKTVSVRMLQEYLQRPGR